MALLLVDGEAASIKALELCCVPGVLVKEQEKEQLIVVHVWKDYIDPYATGTSSTIGGGGADGTLSNTLASNIGAGGPNASSTNAGAGASRSHPPVGTPPLASGAQANMNKDLQTGGLPPQHQQITTVNPLTVMQNAIAVSSTVSYIIGNRYAQSGLNYKIESMRLSPPSASSFFPPSSLGGAFAGTTDGGFSSPSAGNSPIAARQGAGASAGAKKTSSSTAVGSGSSLAPPSGPAPNKGATAPPTSSNATTEPATNQTDGGLSMAAPLTPAELAQQRVACEVSAYAFLRAHHHRRRLIIFGVGNKQNDKKQHALGSTAKAMLDYLFSHNAAAAAASSDYDDTPNQLRAKGITNPPMSQLAALFEASAANTSHFLEGMLSNKSFSRMPYPKINALAVKSTGSTIRPTSTIKYLVLLQLDFEFDESTAYTDTNAEGTIVHHSPKPTRCSLTKSTRAALKVLSQYARRRPASTLQEGGADGTVTNGDDGQQQQHQQQQQIIFDDVGALIVANDGIPIFTPPTPIDPDAPPPPPIKRPKGYVPPKQITVSDVTTTEYLDSLIRPISDEFLEWTIDNNLSKRGESDDDDYDQNGNNEDSGSRGQRDKQQSPSSGPESATTSSPTTTTAGSAAPAHQVSLLPLISKVYLEPNRETPHYPLNGLNAAQQFAKAINAIKPDILVVPSSTPRSVVEAIMALPKPHVLICSE